ncbi:MAG: hypothetical protein Q8K55_10960 [Gemmatimonadaceae bacterium]|nr:hypothetical protein [Gemmatimonadaceae bacterium]
MTIFRRSLAPLITVVVLAVAARALPAQDTKAQAECTNYQPAFRASDPPALATALKRAAWPTTEFDKLLVDSGPAATLRRVRARGLELMAHALVDTAGIPSAWVAVDSVLEAAIAGLQQGRGTTIKETDVPDMSRLRVVQPPMGNALSIAGKPLAFQEADRVSSVAICAVASSADALLTFLLKAELDRTAATYAALDERWTLFATSAYSMTLVERLAASCRLSILGYVLSPTSQCWRRHRQKWTLSELEPPRWRTVFAHPIAGLEPILKPDSAYRTSTIAEWYGILRLEYKGDAIRTWGLSVATVHFASDRYAAGGVLHTPVGRVGVFDGRGGRTLFMLSGDLLRWSPQARTALEGLKTRNLDAIRKSLK